MDKEMGRVDGYNIAAVLLEEEGCTNGIFNVDVLRRGYDSRPCVNTEVPLSAWQCHKQYMFISVYAFMQHKDRKCTKKI